MNTFAGSDAATAFVRDIAKSIAAERRRCDGLGYWITSRIQHILRVEIDSLLFSQLFTPGKIYGRGRMQICGVECYFVADLPAPGWRVINPIYDYTTALPGGEERTHGADSAVND